MTEIQGVCTVCQATIVLPMPDIWSNPEGMIDASMMPSVEGVEAMPSFLHSRPCPSCGGNHLRITMPPERRDA
jgi:hypothetical protein